MQMNKNLRCAMIFMGPFPLGNVSTIRIMSYCKALVKEGVYVKVYIISPTTEAAINKNKKGTVDGVDFEYVVDITWKKQSPSHFYKLCYYIKGLILSLFVLRKDKINCLLTYHDEIISNLLYRVFCSFTSIPFVIDKTEYPKGVFGVSRLKKQYVKLRLRLFDGVITITNELANFYANFLSLRKKNVFLLPMTVDIDRYKDIQANRIDEYIAVMFGVHNRDGLFDSVKAYANYVKGISENPYKLLLIGDFEGLCKKYPENLSILKYIEDENIKQDIIFKGLVDNNDVPTLLVNAKCLLTTPMKYISGGFPTKLGEYLLSGVPVVTTAAGEIPNYLTHGKDILMSPPSNDIREIAQNLIFVHKNPEEANKIAIQGKILAEKVFNANTYIEAMILFLENIRNK